MKMSEYKKYQGIRDQLTTGLNNFKRKPVSEIKMLGLDRDSTIESRKRVIEYYAFVARTNKRKAELEEKSKGRVRKK